MMGSAMMIAAECAQMLTGDSKYLDLIRSQLDVVINRGKREGDGPLQVPFKHTNEGWGEYGTMIRRTRFTCGRLLWMRVIGSV